MNGDVSQRHGALRIVFLGLPGEMSAAVLSELLDDGAAICGVLTTTAAAPYPVDASLPLTPLTPPAAIRLPLAGDPTASGLLQLAWDGGAPVWAVGDVRRAEVHDLLRSLAPDVACVACFSQRIPTAALAIPRYGFLNVHPSLLPAYRGPSPLFWMLRAGETACGVTVHLMNERLDEGDIIDQIAVELPDGLSGSEIDRLLGRAGGRLLRRVLAELAEGRLHRRPQPEGGSAYGRPTAADFSPATDWTARRAFNFLRGTAEWGLPYALPVGEHLLRLAEAIDFSPDDRLDCLWKQAGDEVWVQFSPGVLHARMAERPAGRE